MGSTPTAGSRASLEPNVDRYSPGRFCRHGPRFGITTEATRPEHRALRSAGNPPHRTGHRRRLCRVPRRCATPSPSWKPAKTKAPPPPSGWASATSCSGRYHMALETLKTGDGGALAQFYLGKAAVALKQFDAAAKLLRRRPQGRLQRRRLRPGPGRGRPPGRRLPRLAGDSRQPVGRRRANGRISLSARRLRRGHRRQSDRSRGAVRAGRRGRSQPCRRPVRPGHGKRSPRQRRSRPSTSTSARPYQFPSHVGPLLNLGILYEDRQQYDTSPAVLLSAFSKSFRPTTRARLFLKDAPGLGRHVLRRRRPDAAATA